MNTRMQVLCAWSGIAFLILLFTGMWFVANFIPPPSPSLDADAIAAFYAESPTAIRIGMVIAMIASGFFLPWVAVLSVQMTRMQGVSPVLPLIQAIGGGVVVLIAMMPTVLWLTASFRLERSPELVQLLNDLGWIMLVATFPAPLMQLLSIGIATLSDRQATPVFPRWTGYFNLWMGMLFIPGALIVFFKSGPFSWSGLVGFWIPVGAFALWFLVMTPVLLKAIRQQAPPG